MAEDDADKLRKKIRKPREKGRVGKAADGFAGVWRYWTRRIFRWVLYGLLAAAAFSILLVVTLRYVNPYMTYYYVSERMRLGEINRDWTPLEEFSPVMARSVVAAEDANFCTHFGFDIEGIKAALADEGRVRGGSTISQQVAKNVFLWQGRTWVRKGIEAWFTLLIELFWPKERIVEVYLNIAEMDEGVFGAAAAGRHYFGVEPDKITAVQAGRLAAVLPSPKKRSASRPTAYIKKRTRQIISGAKTIAADGRADCFESG
ncbi:monofunctional biosynthetic peptidoglycan transglycosylase [Amylibacter sp. IMCC11727]|uniref:monofunctional biosynthetic peptidoglycan transglycosylase n=1 Tax=Amylibacter sp. IMCC11727 TaxID=3039851 RepID=UPI00244E34F0|nr:monofunctional biosynthetic peptidoglycan transglycosylase [Amylibacter sp. IMCC11727]WGI22156.1 monofunctional biosynthetic peptidoglycan transglycosylase [Amylibacter sp. IMCC11727]